VERVLARRGITAAAMPADSAGSALRWKVDAPEGVALAEFADDIARALPDALVLSTSDIAEMLSRTIRTLFTFVAAVAALSLLAGVVLIANAVGLGLLERRRELAVLKAMGYSRLQVLRVVLIENGMLGAIGSGFGLLGTFAAILVVNRMLPQASLELHGPASLALLLTGVALAAGTALAVAWPAARVRPLLVLRGE
jgi:ABC-type antimicrobial peptide transport system permease subunit